MSNSPHLSPLTPLSFLERSALVWATRTAVVDGPRTFTYAEHAERVARAAGALLELGVIPGDRVATLIPNRSAMLELTYAVPWMGAVLVPLNTRLSGQEYAYILAHSGARVVIADRSLAAPLEAALGLIAEPPTVVWVAESADDSPYDKQLDGATPSVRVVPDDENALLSINYTSGTTGQPKGVMTTHRGAYMQALGVIADSALTSSSSYLWTLPMFHCNGWCYPWAVTAMGAKHVCLPVFRPAMVWEIFDKQHITHMCGAPTVVTMLLADESAARLKAPVRVVVGGAPPSPTLLERAADLNIDVVHMYGLTETYGPLAVCAWNPAWDSLSPSKQATLRARQGVGTVISERVRVVDDAMADVPPDASTLGEVVMRGNNVMLGYYRDAAATAEAFRGGWFHSGDVGVVHPDGYIELHDRIKDIVISGGENISSIEVEQALVSHPAVVEAAVVGAPHESWGEVPIAFVTITDNVEPDELRLHVRERLAHFKVPARIEIVRELPKTSTGKIQKFVLRERAHTPSGNAKRL